jgi:hypothetical protein
VPNIKKAKWIKEPHNVGDLKVLVVLVLKV